MRIAIGLLVLCVGCSSSSSEDAPAPACVIDGSYTIQGKSESGTCGTVYADSPPQPLALQLETVNGTTRFALQGFTTMPTARVTGCKVDAAVAFTAAAPKLPEANMGTLQFTLNIATNGAVSGSYSLSSPAVTDDGTGKARDACGGTYSVTGSRR